MRCTRIYAAADGRSHFEELDIPLHEMRAGTRSDPITATGLLFRESNGRDDFLELHTAPRRQLVLCLSGEVEIECGDGTKRRFGPGDVYLADDLTGEGHVHREIAGPLRHAWVFLPPEIDVGAWRVAPGP